VAHRASHSEGNNENSILNGFIGREGIRNVKCTMFIERPTKEGNR
jgi:hypothetical protein